MISEFEFYHGAALAKLLHGHAATINLGIYSSPGNASYVVNGKTGLYIKHSAKRMSPWRFTFKKEHQDEIKTLNDIYDHVFTLLVCGKDGVVVLSYVELKIVLDHMHEKHEWISVARNRGQEYGVKGSDGKLLWKIAKNEFPVKIIRQLPS
jgi:hypothetical protein